MARDKKQINLAAIAGDGITCCGLQLFPLKVKDIGVYDTCKSALLVRQATLPASYMVMPYLNALFALEMDSGGKAPLFSCMIRLLSVSTHLEPSRFIITADKENVTRLKRVIVLTGDDSAVELKPGVFAQIREKIAQINGDEIPDESENPELVEAATDLSAQQQLSLEYDLETMISSVAASMNKRPKDVLDWTIYEFKKVREAKTRIIRHIVCGIGEQSGFVKWKHGNPVPCWYLDKQSENAALQPLSELSSRLGI